MKMMKTSLLSLVLFPGDGVLFCCHVNVVVVRERKEKKGQWVVVSGACMMAVIRSG